MSKHSDTNTRDRQAVVVIHGIGEQHPMTTLRQFVDTVLGTSPQNGKSSQEDKPTYYSKPDLISSSFDLRCLVTPGNTRPRTDFYEFYWAHLMPKAGWSRLFDWFWLMMNRPRQTVPKRFQIPWVLLWIGFWSVVIGAVTSIILFFTATQPNTENLFRIPFGIALLGAIVQGIVLAYLGDAATYLSPSPQNMAARHEIRTAGVKLLDSLHRRQYYDRIIVVGHSLGSVIGYDILNYAWHRYFNQHGVCSRPQDDYFDVSEQLIAQLSEIYASLPADIDIVSKRNRTALISAHQDKLLNQWKADWMTATKQLGKQLRENEHPWLVTNFVTMGCPLAHADLLLAKSYEDFQHKVKQRELVTSPPAVDAKGSFTDKINYSLPNNQGIRSMLVPHHAAWTACVTWTNLYFETQLLLKGDFIGGPLEKLFGAGVYDIRVSTDVWGGWFSHIHYWTRNMKNPKADTRKSASIYNLKRAIDLTGKGYRPVLQPHTSQQSTSDEVTTSDNE